MGLYCFKQNIEVDANLHYPLEIGLRELFYQSISETFLMRAGSFYSFLRFFKEYNVSYRSNECNVPLTSIKWDEANHDEMKLLTTLSENHSANKF